MVRLGKMDYLTEQTNTHFSEEIVGEPETRRSGLRRDSEQDTIGEEEEEYTAGGAIGVS
jgi:hypothetical protein